MNAAYPPIDRKRRAVANAQGLSAGAISSAAALKFGVIEERYNEIMRIDLLLLGAVLTAMAFSASHGYCDEEPQNWNDPNTHWFVEDGKTFSNETITALKNAIVYGNGMSKPDLIQITNVADLCDRVQRDPCYVAAIFTVGIDEPKKQYLVWMEKRGEDPLAFEKLWERQSGYGYGFRGSLKVVRPFSDETFPCLLSMTSSGGLGQQAEMNLYGFDRDHQPKLLWNYNGDFWSESTGQGFRRSFVTFQDKGELHQIVLDSTGGWMPGWNEGKMDFEIRRSQIVYQFEQDKYVAITPLPGWPINCN